LSGLRHPRLRLRNREDKRVRAGHLWVYANEVDVAATPLKAFAPGTVATLEDARGKPLGTVDVNPHALLCARVLDRAADRDIDSDWLGKRLRAALALRTRLYEAPYYRMVFGEADGLPGLVVDRYDDVLVVQITTAGMENRREALLEALQAVCAPRGILLRNDVPMRELEGLPLYAEAIGEVPEYATVMEGGLRFTVPLMAGQKTGWFYDQRDNRERMTRLVRGARVLDVFSYVGAWGVRAAAAGAASVTCVDRSQLALDAAQRTADENSLALQTRCGDALDVMRALQAEGARFDVVIVDPPALIKRRKDEQAGLGHYAALNRAAMQLLADDGILISCSCSYHLDVFQLQRLLAREAHGLGRQLQLLESGQQGPDHPVHPAMPETRYLKGFVCRLHVDGASA
jgi:23S rRNA (cytosine1962-C5)-methyltransferase